MSIVDHHRDLADVDPPRLGGIDHLEWWVGNARTFAGFLCSAFGFSPVAYAGPETGRRDRVSYLLEQGGVRFMVSGALHPESPIAAHVMCHGDGVRDVAFLVDDVDGAYDAALRRGGTGLRAPADDTDDHGTVRHAAIATYGDTVHTLLDRRGYHGPFAPTFAPSDLTSAADPVVGITGLDHVVANVPMGSLEPWVEFYEQVFGFRRMQHFDDDQISTEYSALMSTVVWNGETVVMPINEPAAGRKKSQIEEYLDFYGASGVQHIALRTDDIVAAVRALRARGVRFMQVPDDYYVDARARLADVDLPWEDLAALGILVDRDEGGHLLQIFTETITDRPTVFFEIIERRGATGFGEGNFKALFEAIEREQDRRGNL
ncbi:MAG: hppD [Acidimicrobiales bacterium]|nr:hppD [Acidimicrobiales bacterium]